MRGSREVEMKFSDELPSITCPKCGFRSHNINDIRQRYCGNCHAFHDDPIANPAGVAAPKRP